MPAIVNATSTLPIRKLRLHMSLHSNRLYEDDDATLEDLTAFFPTQLQPLLSALPALESLEVDGACASNTGHPPSMVSVLGAWLAARHLGWGGHPVARGGEDASGVLAALRPSLTSVAVGAAVHDAALLWAALSKLGLRLETVRSGSAPDELLDYVDASGAGLVEVEGRVGSRLVRFLEEYAGPLETLRVWAHWDENTLAPRFWHALPRHRATLRALCVTAFEEGPWDYGPPAQAAVSELRNLREVGMSLGGSERTLERREWYAAAKKASMHLDHVSTLRRSSGRSLLSRGTSRRIVFTSTRYVSPLHTPYHEHRARGKAWM